jgi:hypothetical protein
MVGSDVFPVRLKYQVLSYGGAVTFEWISNGHLLVCSDSAEFVCVPTEADWILFWQECELAGVWRIPSGRFRHGTIDDGGSHILLVEHFGRCVDFQLMDLGPGQELARRELARFDASFYRIMRLLKGLATGVGLFNTLLPRTSREHGIGTDAGFIKHPQEIPARLDSLRTDNVFAAQVVTDLVGTFTGQIRPTALHFEDTLHSAATRVCPSNAPFSELIHEAVLARREKITELVRATIAAHAGTLSEHNEWLIPEAEYQRALERASASRPRCPRCEFSYQFDGTRCGHCGCSTS